MSIEQVREEAIPRDDGTVSHRIESRRPVLSWHGSPRRQDSLVLRQLAEWPLTLLRDESPARPVSRARAAPRRAHPAHVGVPTTIVLLHLKHPPADAALPGQWHLRPPHHTVCPSRGRKLPWLR